MTDDEELEKLEEEFRRSFPKRLVEPGSNEDREVLSMALDHLNRPGLNTLIGLDEYRKRKRRWQGLSLAAGLAIGFVMSEILVESQVTSSLFSSVGRPVFMDGASGSLESQEENLSPTELQTLIAELVVAGELDEADALLHSLKERYSDFESE